jgi:hypothetical protein
VLSIFANAHGCREGVELPAGERVIAEWDERLTDVMLEKAVVVHEEAVVETLLIDLTRGSF